VVHPYQEADLSSEELARCAEALHVLHSDGRSWVAEHAILHILEELGYARSVRLLRAVPLKWTTGTVYRFVARHRSRLAHLTASQSR